MSDFAEYRKRRKPHSATVRLPADPSWPEQVADARAAVAEAERADRQSNDKSPSPATIAARERLAEIEQQAVEDVLVFRFVEIPRPDYEDLIEAHPPPKAEKDEKRWNNDTFIPALMVACCVEPGLTLEHATEIWTGNDNGPAWGKWSADQLAAAAIDVNERASKAPTTPRG